MSDFSYPSWVDPEAKAIIFQEDLEENLQEEEKEEEKTVGEESPEEAPSSEEIVEDSQELSEDSHGGSEASGEIEDSPNTFEEGEEEASVEDSQEGQPKESSEFPEEESVVESDGESPLDPSEEEPSGNGEDESSTEGEGSGESSEGAGTFQEVLEEQSNEFLERLDETEETQEESDMPDSKKESFEEPPEDDSTDLEVSDLSELIDETIEDEDETDKESNDSSNNSKQGGNNANKAFSLTQKISPQKLQASFARLVRQIAEREKETHSFGVDKWDMNRLLLRSKTKSPLSSCKQAVEYESVILLLDTSGSCYSYADYFSTIAQLAEKLGDVEIYEAPNAELYQEEECVFGDWGWKNRTILFFGDFDGGKILCHQSKINRLIWCSCEERYDRLDQHSWCYGLSLKKDFKGTYIEAASPEEFIKKLRKPIKR